MRLGKSRPGDPNSHAVRAIPNAAPGRSSNASAASRSPASFEAPYGLPGSVGSVGCHGRPSVHSPLKTSLVETISRSVPALGAGLGQDAGRVRRCAGSPAPDRGRSRRHRSRPRRGRRPRAGRDRGAPRSPSGASRSNASRSPGDRAGRAGEGRIGEGRDERAPETAARPGDGDAHQSAVGAFAAAVVPVASRCPYWRAYQPSQSPERAARHHASFARYQSIVAARPSSNVVARLPAEARQLRAVHRVAPVVARPVLDLHDQRPRLAEVVEEERDDVAVGPFRRPGDVVGLARLAVTQDVVDRGGVVGDVQPFATLQAVAVERQRAVVEGVRDEQRDQLLGMVVRPVRVRAAGHDGVDAMGDDVAPDEQLAGRLGRRVRRAWRERRVLAGVALVDRAVDLVGRDLQEARPARGRAARLEQDVDADDAGRQERLGLEDRAVDVRFGGEVDHGVGRRRRAARRPPRRRCRRARTRSRAAISGSSRTGARFASLPA